MRKLQFKLDDFLMVKPLVMSRAHPNYIQRLGIVGMMRFGIWITANNTRLFYEPTVPDGRVDSFLNLPFFWTDRVSCSVVVLQIVGIFSISFPAYLPDFFPVFFVVFPLVLSIFLRVRGNRDPSVFCFACLASGKDLFPVVCNGEFTDWFLDVAFGTNLVRPFAKRHSFASTLERGGAIHGRIQKG